MSGTSHELRNGMPWGKVFEWLEARGFEIVAQTSYDRGGYTYHTVTAAHRRHKLLLHARSIVHEGVETLNDCSLDGAIRQREGMARSTFFAGVLLASGGPYEGSPLFGRFYADAQRPLGLMIDQMLAVGEFVDWGMRPPYGFVELRNLAQAYDLNMDWSPVFLAFLGTCPEWVRDFMLRTP